MRVLGSQWKAGYLDETRTPGTCRIQVHVWENLQRVDHLVFERKGDWRLVWNYLQEIGLSGVLRKVRSRRAEALRNVKHLACGFGTVLEADSQSPFEFGDPVVFIAPCHPACQDRIVLPNKLVSGTSVPFPRDEPRIQFRPLQLVGPALCFPFLAGWSPHSGITLDGQQIAQAAAEAERLLQSDRQDIRLLEVDRGPVREWTVPRVTSRQGERRKRAVLFGYGNYAKTVVLPSLARTVEIARIHEVDPTQIPTAHSALPVFDTSPRPRDGRGFNAYFIAGFHHHHAPLAIEALSNKAYACVEKPLATSQAQLDDLARALKTYPDKFFACFQKRYSPFTALARLDLVAQDSEPINYSCIVYEEPLPARHWYRWPVSGSRIVSNGCHWIDHFLYLNGYPHLTDVSVWEGDQSLVNVSATAENGSVFTMVLTDVGSRRTGVRDHVELRRGNTTVTITDGTHYAAETTRKRIRKRRIGRLLPYKIMYRLISNAIANGEPGDDLHSILVSTQSVLDIEQEYQAIQTRETG